jgi:adenylosuccinate lyase
MDTLFFDTARAALHAVSPIDGRYAKVTKDLSQYSSEYALMKYRLLVETHYFIKLHEVLERPLDEQQIKFMEELYKYFDDEVSESEK